MTDKLEFLSVLGENSEKLEKLSKLRTRDWAFVMYPESMPEDSLNILQNFHIPFAVSPLHDKDLNADGKPKKAHYHVLITADGMKSLSQLVDMAKAVNGTNLINIQSARGYYRYLTHEDNPEKYKYNPCDIRHFCGFEPSLYDKPLSVERYKMISDMMQFITDNNITEFFAFSNICRETHFSDWFPLLCDNSAVIITNFIKSLRHFNMYENNVSITHKDP